MKFSFYEMAGTVDGKTYNTDRILDVLKHYDKPWTFVSYQNFPKFGINPQYQWGMTPNAIYGYKIQYIIDVLSEPFRQVGFGSEKKYITIFTVKDEAKPYILDLEEIDAKLSSFMKLDGPKTLFYSDRTFSKNKEKLNQHLNSILPQLPNLMNKISDKFADISPQDVLYNTNTPLASLLGILRVKSHDHFEIIHDKNHTETLKKQKQSNFLRKVFISLGIRGYLAKNTYSFGGAGAIQNECIFFYSADLIQVAQFTNRKNVKEVPDTGKWEDRQNDAKGKNRYGTTLSSFINKINKILEKLSYTGFSLDDKELQEALHFIRIFAKTSPEAFGPLTVSKEFKKESIERMIQFVKDVNLISIEEKQDLISKLTVLLAI